MKKTPGLYNMTGHGRIIKTLLKKSIKAKKYKKLLKH